MNRRLWVGLLLVSPGLVGCTPPGPREFYRGALQARSEFVDSLSRVVDDKTAKEKFSKSEKLFKSRMSDIKEGLEKAKYDGGFNKLRRGNFNLKNLEADDRAGMIHGIKSYAEYCRNIVFTNVRFKRETDRLTMVMNMEVLEKARAQIESNQPVTAAKATDAPNMEAMFDGLSKMNEVNLRFVPEGMTKEMIDLLEGGIDAADIALVLNFDPKNLDAKAKDLTAPALPAYPAWAIETDRRAKLGLTDGGGKR